MKETSLKVYTFNLTLFFLLYLQEKINMIGLNFTTFVDTSVLKYVCYLQTCSCTFQLLRLVPGLHQSKTFLPDPDHSCCSRTSPEKIRLLLARLVGTVRLPAL